MKRILYTLMMTAVVGVGLSSCMAPPNAPIPYLFDGRLDGTEHRQAIIFLHGRGGKSHHFFRHGFVNEVRRRHLLVDIVAPAAHVGYYRSQTLVERLREDIIKPLRRRGY